MDFQHLFDGFQNSKPLWTGTFEGLEQCHINNTNVPFQWPNPIPRLRLGRWVEIFIKHQLAQDPQIKLLTDNLQILQKKQTIGELDFLFIKNSQPIHLEVVYKYYLYDNLKSYKNPIDYWIGPNRSDSLGQKLDKLNSKQLPLLHHPSTLVYLDRLGLNPRFCLQQVCFKAELFVPLKENPKDIFPLNKGCISGFYINLKELYKLEDFMFFLPPKLMWLADPQHQVTWNTLSETLVKLKDQCQKHRSVLVWLQDSESNLQKAFVTWW